jgi:Fe-S cluster assembly ATP-binding protein
MLSIRDLHVAVGAREVLRGVDLEVGAGEVHAVMGPNGAGKSTLAHVLAGKDGYTISSGRVELDGADLLALSPEERAVRGLFLAFQYPVEIPGIGNLYFLRAALNALRRQRGLDEIDAFDFLELAREQMRRLELGPELLERPVNQGFSGGEKKRNEVFQMALLAPRLAILDETDSGLDIDALRVVAKGINAMRAPDRAMLVITHYQRLLEYVVPDRVHVLVDGRIVESGDAQLARDLEASGYRPRVEARP